MIFLSYERFINGKNLPSRIQPVIHSGGILTIRTSAHNKSVFEKRLIRTCKIMIEHKRRFLDISHYCAAQRGYRFEEGNSQIITENFENTPIFICLSHSNSEDSENRRSPSMLDSSHIRGMVWAIKNMAPNLVDIDGVPGSMIENNDQPPPVSHPYPLRSRVTLQLV